MKHTYPFNLLAILGLALLPIVLSSCGDRSSSPPNLILVTLDTTRADRLGCYGHAQAVTPVLDSLAARGVLFEHAYTSVPLTLPAHSSILTGLYPTRHGVRDNGIFLLADSLRTVAEILKEAGYQTGAFVSAFVLAKTFGTAQGFTTYDDHFYGERSARMTSRAAARWIDKLDPGRPFFLWLHFYDPHAPRKPPEPFASLPGLDLYDQEVAGMDAGLGWFLGRLRAKGLLAHTDFVIVGDHGEGLGDHGENEHGLFLYGATLHVPLLLVRHDGRWAGRRVRQVATVEDVTPTLLALAGAPAPPVQDGIDLQMLARGKAGGDDRASYAETYFPETTYYHSHMFALRTLEWNYVSAPRPEIYDLTADPGELHDLAHDQPQMATSLSERLQALRERTLTGPQDAHALASGQLQQLQSLGYLGGGQVAAEVASGSEFVLPDAKDLGDLSEVFSRGAAAISAGNLEEGRACMLAVLARNPENVIARINLGKAYIRLHQPAAAIEQLEQAVLLSPQSGTAKKFLGMAYQVAGRYDEALATLRQLENDPTQDISAGIEIGRTQLLMGQPEEAQHTFRALADRLGNSPTFTHMAELTGRYIEARRALDRKPNDEEARLDLAGAAIDLELPQLAESALRFRPSTPQIAARRHMALGSVAGAQGDEATALAEYEQARPVLGRDPYLRTQLVGLYLGAGRVDEALALAEELIREGHVTSVTYYNQACALARLGRTDEAFTALRRAVNAGYDNLQNLSTDPDLASLCGDERFMEILDLVADRSK